MRIFKNIRSCALAVLIWTLASTAAHAWGYDRCRGRNVIRGGDSVTLEANQNDFPAGSPWRGSLETAVDAWNNRAPATNFRFGLVFNTAADDDRGDGRNAVVLNPAFTGVMVARSLLSACFWPFWRREILETDVVANPNRFWFHDVAPAPFRANNSSVLAFIHELGHVMGLQHEDNILTTMNSFTPAGGALGNDDDPHPHSDDVAGNRGGYGTPFNADDLAASAFRRTGAGTAAVIIPPAQVSRGNPSSFQFTVMNRGTINRTVRVDFFLSTDRRITAADTNVGSTTLVLNAGVTRTLVATVTLPFSVTPGFYHFGYIVDAGGAVGEVDEGNNAAGHNSRTQIVTTSPPNACFTVTPTFGNAPLLVTVNAGCSSDPDGTITSYTWNMGDGTIRTGSSFSYIYTEGGEYSIQLTVRDNDNLTDTTFNYVFAACDGGILCEV